MPTIYAKNAKTGEIVREEITEEEAVNRGIRENAQKRQARIARQADRETNKNRALVGAFADLLIDLRDGRLDGLTKPEIMARMKQRVAAALE